MTRDLGFSFEMFPPRDGAGHAQFNETAVRLAALGPRFCSVTYGAGGSTREGSEQAMSHLRRETDLAVAAHLTCAGQSRKTIDQIAQRWRQDGIRQIVALRGDAGDQGVPAGDGYDDAAALVFGLRSIGDFDISVACYPEGHPKSVSRRADLLELRRKLEAGAAQAISQFFFEPETFLRFRDAAASEGITRPLIPGILPILNFNKVAAFAARCGTRIPPWLADRFRGLENDSEAHGQVAASLGVTLCERLIAEGVSDFHFYTLNRPTLTLSVCRAIGIRTQLENAA